MTTALLARRFLLDAVRNRVSIMMLILIPVVFVAIAARAMEAAAEQLGGAGGPQVQIATAGWAAGFISAVAMYFQIQTARTADQRLVLSGLAPARLVGARLAAGFCLALVASSAALVTLAARSDIAQPGRVVAGTMMFALIYLGIGAVVGAFVRDAVNGTALILFVWILDAFFGPALGSADRLVTRVLPSHFVTLWMMDVPSHHAGRPGDLGWALAWTALALSAGWFVITRATRIARTSRRSGQLSTGIRLGVRQAARNHVLWALLVAVPVVFVLLAVATTPRSTITVLTLRDAGHEVALPFRLRPIHGGLMAPIAIAPLAALTGLFTVLDGRAADQRLALAGFHPASLLLSRLTVVALGAVVATGAALAAAAPLFHARQWGLFVVGNLLIALTYALIGVLLGPLVGRVGGVLIAFLVPFLDLAVEQSPMLHSVPPTWAHYLPGYGATRILYEAGLTSGFDDTGSLLVASAWMGGLLLATGRMFRASTAS